MYQLSVDNQCEPLSILERVKGIEPSYAAWEAAVLPLNYTRITALIIDRISSTKTINAINDAAI